jgi:hypothetical protein
VPGDVFGRLLKPVPSMVTGAVELPSAVPVDHVTLVIDAVVAGV